MPPRRSTAKPPKSPPKAEGKPSASKTAKPRSRRAARHDHQTIRLKMIELGGNVSAVADAFAVTRQTVYNWIERYGLRDVVAFERAKMFELAERNIYYEVERGSFEASKFVLTHMPVAERWSSKSEVALDMLPPDVVEQLKRDGIDVKQVFAEFAQMIREQKAADAK